MRADEQTKCPTCHAPIHMCQGVLGFEERYLYDDSELAALRADLRSIERLVLHAHDGSVVLPIKTIIDKALHPEKMP